MTALRALVAGTALLALAAALQGCRAGAPRESSATPPVGTSPEVSLPVTGHGDEVKLEEHLVAGKTTVFDFYSEQCPACMMLAPELEKLAAKRPDLAIVKVDVNRPDVTDRIDWDSPVARQHNLESLPHLVIFDADGKEVASGEEAFRRVTDWLGS